MIPAELKTFSNTLVSVIFFASNIRLWQQSGYFDTAGELKPLLHTWSLAVEEQYYIFFPIAVLLLWRVGRRNALWSIALVAILSLALSEYASRYYAAANFYMLPTRAWELLAGALCPFAIVKPSIPRDDILSLAGLIAIATSVFGYDETIPFPSLYALLPVLGTCAILLFAREGTLVGSLLSLKPIVGIGLISYSAYLWHQPLFAFARIRSLTEPTWQLMLLLAFVTFALAYLSWRLVEVPTRRRGSWPLPNRRMVFALLGTVAVAFITFGVAGHFTKGFPLRLPSESRYFASFSDARNLRYECISSPKSPLPNQTCIYGTKDKLPEFALLGDSHVHALAPEIGKVLSQNSSSLIEFAYGGCPPIHTYRRIDKAGILDCNGYHKAVIDILRNMPNVKTVFLAARWPLYIELGYFNNREGGVESASKVYPIREDLKMQNDANLKTQIGNLYQNSITELLSLGKRVVLVYPQPEIGWNVPDHVSKLIMFKNYDKRPLSIGYDIFKERMKSTYFNLDKVTSDHLLRIYPEYIFCNTYVKDRCVAEDGKVPFYSDDDHVDSIGAALISQEIMRAMHQKGWLVKHSEGTNIGQLP